MMRLEKGIKDLLDITLSGEEDKQTATDLNLHHHPYCQAISMTKTVLKSLIPAKREASEEVAKHGDDATNNNFRERVCTLINSNDCCTIIFSDEAIRP